MNHASLLLILFSYSLGSQGAWAETRFQVCPMTTGEGQGTDDIVRVSFDLKDKTCTALAFYTYEYGCQDRADGICELYPWDLSFTRSVTCVITEKSGGKKSIEVRGEYRKDFESPFVRATLVGDPRACEVK